MALTQVQSGILADSTQTYGMKNRIINGAMVIDQRNAGASVTITAVTSQFSVDRWNLVSLAASKFSVQQNAAAVTPPAGFKNYVGITSLSAYAVAATDVFAIRQSIEGYNIADLGWGAAGAQTVTLSFWVRSSLTGTFGGNLQNSAQTQSYPFSYTISTANTWEQKSITIAGSTTATWEATNGMGMQVAFSVGSGTSYSGTSGAWVASNIWSVTGATSVVGTNGATFYITGVQLEKGSTATSFDFRDIGREFILCQRYYQSLTCANYAGFHYSTSGYTGIFLPVCMRVTPTVLTTSSTTWYEASVPYTWTATNIVGQSPQSISLQGTISGGGGGTNGFAGTLQPTFTVSAEL